MINIVGYNNIEQRNNIDEIFAYSWEYSVDEDITSPDLASEIIKVSKEMYDEKNKK